MIRLTLAALAVTIALPALANGDWTEPETPEPPAPEPETPGCPDCENPPMPQPETPVEPEPEPEQPTEPSQPETPAERRFTPQSSDGETRLARVPPCCTRDGVIVAKRTLFGIGQGKAIEYCAKVDPATIPACEVKVKP